MERLRNPPSAVAAPAHEYLAVFARCELKKLAGDVKAAASRPRTPGPAENANGVPQSGRPKRVCLHERIDDVRAIGFDHPQPTGGIVRQRA